MRIAYFSPLPPQPNGIADYSRELLPHLAHTAEIDLVVEDGFRPDTDLAATYPILSFAEFEQRRMRYDVCLYQMGNGPHHSLMRRALALYPGVIALHEATLHHGIVANTVGQGDFASYVREMGYSYGLDGVRLAEAVRRGECDYPYFRLPLNERVLDLSLGVIVHSAYVRDRVLATRPGVRLAHIRQGVTPLLPAPDVRARLGLPAEALIVGSFGLVSTEKRLDLVLRAFARLRASRAEALCLIVGEVPALYPSLAPLIAELGLADAVECTGRAPNVATFTSYIAAADIAVNLRQPTVGETSASLLRVMAAGVAAIVTDAGWYAELPEGTCLKLPPDAGEEVLAETLEMLARHPDRRQRIGAQARDYVARAHRWEDTAEGYLGFLRGVLT